MLFKIVTNTCLTCTFTDTFIIFFALSWNILKFKFQLLMINITILKMCRHILNIFIFAACSLDSSQSPSGQPNTVNLLSVPSCERDQREYNGLDFRIVIDSKSGPPITITLIASTLQEKAAWCSDIGQVRSPVQGQMSQQRSNFNNSDLFLSVSF